MILSIVKLEDLIFDKLRRESVVSCFKSILAFVLKDEGQLGTASVSLMLLHHPEFHTSQNLSQAPECWHNISACGVSVSDVAGCSGLQNKETLCI
jgi:hypothetical protein